MNETENPKRSPWLTAWLVISQLGYLLSLLPWFALTFLAANIYEGGASWEKHLLFIPILIFPILPLAASIAAWVAFARYRTKTAALVMFAPVLYVACFCSGMALLWDSVY